jgi:outer membrane protein assembly factor BamA
LRTTLADIVDRGERAESQANAPRGVLWFLLLAFGALVAPPVRAEDPEPPTAAAPAVVPLDTWGTNDEEPAPSQPANEPKPKDAPRAPAAVVAPPPLPCVDCVQTSVRRKLDDTRVRYTLEAIRIRGNTRTSSRVILRYVKFAAGDVFDVDDPEVELTRYRLLGTGFFRDVQFSLGKGSERGRIVLVIDVAERNTIVINDLSMGLSADADTQGNARPLTAYAGLDVAETNLGGTGMTLGTAAAFAQGQTALRLRFLDPAFLGSAWMTSAMLLYADAKDYFGNAGVLQSDRSNTGDPRDFAIVRYERFGGSLGVGRDLSVSTQLWLQYRLEAIHADYPSQASHLRGFAREPIDFEVIRGRSVLSTLRATLEHDTRDHPILPTRGWFFSFTGELGVLPTAPDYEYQRFEIDLNHHLRLPWHGHVLKLGLYAGALAGNAPFFEQFYVGDFSDFLPDRVLGVNFDRRPPPNFLGTQIVEVRYGDYAFKLGGEYRIPLYRGRRSVFGIDAFASAGIYGLGGARDIRHPAEGYSGLARIPLDLTGNLGFRIDTSAGGFVFAFSNLLGFFPVRGEGPAGGD